MKLKKVGSIIAVAVLLIVSVCGSASSEVRPGAVDVTLFGGGYLFEGNQPFKSDASVFGVGLGYTFSENWGVDLSFTNVENEIKVVDTDVNTYLLRLDGLYYFNFSETLVPYLSVGAGGIRHDPKDAHEHDDFFASYGAGLKYFITKNISLKADVRHILHIMDNHDFYKIDEHYNNMLYTLGLNVQFGGEEKAEEAPVPVDTDNDGIADDKDKCPNTPANVKVDRKGCPVDSDKDGVADYLDRCVKTPKGVKTDANGCPVDSDNDGIADYMDKCNNTPKGAKVDKKGCTKDSDNDGVLDHLDKCNNTPAGATVDNRGCWTLTKIRFNTGSAALNAGVKVELNEIILILKKNPGLKIVVEGHTDSLGSETLNQTLSEKRAKAIRKYIIKKNISADRVSAVGYGEAKPVADNGTNEGRAKNRRVEFRPVY